MFLISELIALLCANLVFTQALGTSTILIAVRNKTNLAGIAAAITVFSTLGSIAAFFFDKLIPSDKEYWLLICYCLVIAVIYVASLFVLSLMGEKIFEKCKLYVHLSAYNCAVAGSIFTVHENAVKFGYSFGDYALFGFEAGIGFVLAALIIMAAYKKLSSSNVPASFRGFPAMLVYIGIISMAIYSLK